MKKLQLLLFTLIALLYACGPGKQLSVHPPGKKNPLPDSLQEAYIPASEQEIQRVMDENEYFDRQAEMQRIAPAAPLAPAAAIQFNLPANTKIVEIACFENTNYNDATNQVPKLKELLSKGVDYRNFWAIDHPSQPNYVRMLFNRSLIWDNNDHASEYWNYINMITALQAKGKTFKSFHEGMRNVGDMAFDEYPYLGKHNAVRMCDNVNLSQVMFPATYLPTDLKNLPDFTLYSPDMINSGHDGGMSKVQAWLTSNPNAIRLINAALDKNDGIPIQLWFTFDEGNSSSNQIVFGAIGEGIKPGTVVTSGYDQHDGVNMFCDIFGIPWFNTGITKDPNRHMTEWVMSSDTTGPVIPPDTIKPPVVGTGKTAKARAATLKNGTNYPYAEEYYNGNPLVNYTNYLNLGDLPFVKSQLALISMFHFQTVRMPFAFMYWGNSGSLIMSQMQYFAALDSMIKWAGMYNLNAVIDNHGAYLTNSNYATESNRIIAYWKIVANHIKNTNPEKVFVELLNEPTELLSDANWKMFVNSLITALRPILPNHTFIVGGTVYNQLYTLQSMGVLNDTNIIYTYHFYEPYIGTHAGAPWIKTGDVATKYLPYPFGSAPMPPISPAVITSFGKDQYIKYPAEATITNMFNKNKIISDWSKQKNVPIWMGETGMLKLYMTSQSRCNYSYDIKFVADSLKIPYAWWEWRESFSFFNGVPSMTSMDTCILRRLGFSIPQNNLCWRKDTTFRTEAFFVNGCSQCSRQVIDKITDVQIPCPVPISQPVASGMARMERATPNIPLTDENMLKLLNEIIAADPAMKQ